MSRNSKSARNLAIAKVCSKARQDGNPGPSSTTPKHTKRWTYRSNPEIMKRRQEGAGLATGGRPRGARVVIENVGAAAI